MKDIQFDNMKLKEVEKDFSSVIFPDEMREMIKATANIYCKFVPICKLAM